MKKRDIVIDGILYLRRWFLTPLSWRWRIFIHRIYLPDANRDLHMHPWDFWTICLWGGYTEVVARPIPTGPEGSDEQRWAQWESRVEKTRWLWPRFRRAEHTHRIIDVKPNTFTLVFASRARRPWGFRRLSAEGWQRGIWEGWRGYLGLLASTPDSPEDQVL